MKDTLINNFLKSSSLFLVIILVASCNRSPYPGIPKDSKLQDEAFGISLFIHVDDSTCHPKKVSVWSFNDETKEAKLIVSSTGEEVAVWCKSDSIKSYWSKDSIASIYSAKIISWPNEPLKIVVDGCPDRRNIWTYIISEASDSVILLPTNAGFLGQALEEDILIGQSYEYYGQGSKYNVLKVFDVQGNTLKIIPLNQEIDVPDELYQAALEHDWKVTIKDLQKLVISHPNLSVMELIRMANVLYGEL